MKSPSKNEMGILGSCKQKAFGKWCRLPKFHYSTYSAVQVGGALSDLHAVQCSGRGSEPTGLDLIIRSAVNFDNDPISETRSTIVIGSPLPSVVIWRWEALTAGDKNFSSQGEEGGLGSVNTYNLSSGRQQRSQLARTSLLAHTPKQSSVLLTKSGGLPFAVVARAFHNCSKWIGSGMGYYLSFNQVTLLQVMLLCTPDSM